MTAIHLHPEAQAEINGAERFYTRRAPATGRRFLTEALHLLERVQEAPRQFPEYALIAVPHPIQTLFLSVRRAVMPDRFPYVLFYYVRQTGPVVLAVAHQRQRPGYWIERL